MSDKIISQNQSLIIGVDEVGRGCLAGPVFASAVAFRSDEGLSQFKDSKALSEKKRNQVAELILGHHWVGIGQASPQEIDAINILQASFLAMRRAIAKLVSQLPSGFEIGVVVDGHLPIPDLNYPQEPIVQGDQLIPEISAASIVAKVTRDRLMKELSHKYPVYGFEKHKGYPSPVHKAAIAQNGPSEIHRTTFRGVKEWC